MSRPVTVTTISLPEPTPCQSLNERIETALEYVDRALLFHPDLILLPESYPVYNGSEKVFSQALAMSDSINRLVGEKARQGNCYILNTIPERHDGRCCTTAFLLDRSGKVCFQYSKSHLAAFEQDLYGIVPGEQLPVYETDFGTVGIMICVELHFPEIAGTLALKGARLLMMPTQAYGPSQDLLMSLIRCRAFDNQVSIAVSNFSQEPYFPGKSIGRSCVVSVDGTILADTGNRSGVAACQIDLEDQCLFDWGYTDQAGRLTERFPGWRSYIRQARRPRLYHPITASGREINKD